MDDDQSKPDKAKRGYRACLHCRSRKAKCDLGDIDAPSEPPCSRCKRESRECVFAPSRRGGNNVRRKSRGEDARPDPESLYPGNGHSHTNNGQSFANNGHGFANVNNGQAQPPGDMRPFIPEPRAAFPYHRQMEEGPVPGVAFAGPLRPSYGASINDLIHRSPSTNLYPLHNPPSAAPSSETPTSMPTGHSDPLRHVSASPSPKRRRLHLNPPLHVSDPSSIVVANMQNESDALTILALASGQAGSGGEDGKRNQGEEDARGRGLDPHGGRARESGASHSDQGKILTLDDFALVKLGIVATGQVAELSQRFFGCYHTFFPMVPPDNIPRNDEELARFAHEERYLLTAAVIITSKHHPAAGMKEIHDKSWAVMRGWISDIQCLGAPPTVGLIEALLLLAENLPRDPVRSNSKKNEPNEIHAMGVGEEVHGAENRQAWMLIGTAIRCAYGLGIEKHALRLHSEQEKTPELERAKLAWTYCYLFDRHISLRLGKAFWSRGPSVCFQGFSSSSQTGPAAAPGNFGYLVKEGASPHDDYASLVQAYLELSQMMSTAHDVLWPNPARTRSLMIYGEYFKYIDELARSIDGFRILWAHKKWTTFPLADCVTAMLHYVTLVVTAFSFQSHLERSAARAEEENRRLEEQRANGTAPDNARPSLSLFPRGAAHSPDARYIFQSMDSARALLEICVSRLHPGGILPYLPWRYLLWFTYAAVLLLKALYSGAMLRADHSKTLKLIDKLCACFADASADDDHPAVRYGRQLEALKKKLSVMSDSTNQSSPTGGHTVPLPPFRQTPNSQPGLNVPATGPWPTTAGVPEPSGLQEAASWSLPYPQNINTPKFSFSYPNSPVNAMNPMNPGGIAPPHHLPISEMHNIQTDPMTNTANLGFTTLDDWFANGNNGFQDGDEGGDVFGGLDLQDFWFQVGPGEAQGGFPFR